MTTTKQSIENGSILETEICIVGSGVAGITIAREFLDTDTNVIVLESGGTGQNRFVRELCKGENIGMPYWALDFVRQRQLGGTAAGMWFLKLFDGRKGLRLRPLDEIDYEKREGIPYSGWPISFDDIHPYYHKTDILFETNNGTPWDLEQDVGHFSRPGTGMQSVNFKLSPSELFEEKYPKLLREAENIRIILESTALEIRTTDDGNTVVDIRVSRPDRTEFSIRAKYFVIATGGLEAPRLLLLSQGNKTCGIGNDYGNVGRYFMEHPHFVSGTIVPTDRALFNGQSPYFFKEYAGVTQLAKLTLKQSLIKASGSLNFCINLSPGISDDHRLRQSKGFDAVRVLRSHLAGGSLPNSMGTVSTDILKGLPLIAREGLRFGINKVREKFGNPLPPKHFDLFYMTEQIPNPDSRVTLGEHLDAFGQPRLKLDWKVSAEDISNILESQKILGKQLEESGLGKLVPDEYTDMPPPGIRGGYHHMGTTRMSDNPHDGVVDKNCKIHGLSNLFVAGSSVFPTVGYANPTFTIGAFSLRLADHLKEQLNGTF